MSNKLNRFLSFGLTFIILLSSFSTSIFAVSAEFEAEDSIGVINYVSLGASNTNGYGLDGYLPAESMEYPDPTFKESVNVYGYDRAPAEGYPSLVSEALAGFGYNVNLNQLAISSMRAEELHMLLDNNYYGDSYTKWRFYNDNGEGWFAQAENGGLSVLREKYQQAVSEADLITVDIGVNNFGVYAINRITTGGSMYDADLSQVFSESDLERYNSYKAKILDIIKGESDVSNPSAVSSFDLIADTFAYALTGFCSNFDATIGRIYDLNPDVSIVVVSIQNLMQGVTAAFEGVESPIPLGEIYGAVVDMANIYTASSSPYCNKYVYANAGENGHAQTFLDEIKSYNGDPSSLTKNMKDCFDVYDNNLWVRSRIILTFIEYINSQIPGIVTGFDSVSSDFVRFMLAVRNDEIAINGVPVRTFFSLGAAGQLGEAQPYYSIYELALNTAYDIVAKIMQAGANINSLDLSVLSTGYGNVQDDLLNYISDSVFDGIEKVIADPSYSFVMDPFYTSNPLYATVMAMGVRFDIGNSFFAHPNVTGHIEIKDAIIDALKNNTNGQPFATEKIKQLIKTVLNTLESFGIPTSYESLKQKPEFKEASEAYYVPDSSSKYVSIGDSGVTDYGLKKLQQSKGNEFAGKFAKEYDVEYTQLGLNGIRVEDIRAILDENYVPDNNTLIGDISSYRSTFISEIESADFITVGFSNNVFMEFVANQLTNPIELDWEHHVGEKYADYFEKIFAEIEAYLVGSVGSALASYMSFALESYAYSYVGFSVNYKIVLDKIHELNPDALVAVIGMYNPVNGLVIETGGMKVDLGDYISKIVDLSNTQYAMYAIDAENTVFVEIPDTETSFDELNNGNITLENYITTFLNNSTKNAMYPNLNGHEYIKNRIIECISVEPSYIIGDVNLDGEINMDDVIKLLRHVSKAEVITDSQALAAGEIIEDGQLNMDDVIRLLRYVSKAIPDLK